MSKLKAVFFDLDDTLYTSFQAGDRYAYECMEKWAQKTFGEAGHGFDAAFLTARKQLAAEQPDMPPIHDRVLFAQRALENMGLNAVPHARKAAAVYWDAVFAKMTVRPGAPEFMDELHAHGIRIAVVTNMLADIQMEKLMRLGLSERIDYLVTSEEAGIDKPHRTIFDLAMRKCGVQPDEALMVGDNFTHDVCGAHEAGISGIWLNWTHKERPESEVGCFEAHDFLEAADHIRTLFNLGGQEQDAAF